VARPAAAAAFVLCALCALCAGAGAGCDDDPYDGVGADPCAPGNVRTSGSACAAPVAAIVIDGDLADWASVPLVPLAPACLVDSCAGVVADGVQVARANDSLGRPALAFHVRLAGGAAPPVTGDVDYVIELSETPEYPANARDQLILSALHEPRYLRNGFEIKPPLGLAPPYTVAITPDGVEGTFSLGILPFPFGARLAVYAVRLDAETHVFRDVVERTPAARVCWIDELPGAGYRGDPCRRQP
jgi:hypothetical protein